MRTEFADCQRAAFEFTVFRRRHLRIRVFPVEFAVFQWEAFEIAVSQGPANKFAVSQGLQLNFRIFRARPVPDPGTRGRDTGPRTRIQYTLRTGTRTGPGPGFGKTAQDESRMTTKNSTGVLKLQSQFS